MANPGKTVVVTGASGLLGTNLCLLLIDEGHDVVALFRSEASIAHLRRAPGGDRIRFVKGDLDDAVALDGACAGADVVFHVAAAVSILPNVTPALVRANVDGTRNVLAAVHKATSTGPTTRSSAAPPSARGPRLVHVSSTVAVGLAATGPSGGGPEADEQTVWNLREAGLADGYSITKRESEELVMKATSSDGAGAGRGGSGGAHDGGGGIDAVVVNPGYMFGPWDSRPSSGKLIFDVARGKVPGTTPGINNFVDVRDVARGMIQAWHKGTRGERYILGGHNLTYQDILNRIAARAGVRPPRRQVPRLAAAAIGAVGDLQASLTGKEPLLTSAAVRWAFCDRFRVTSQKAQRELGYTISPIEPAIDASLAWFKENGRL